MNKTFLNSTFAGPARSIDITYLFVIYIREQECEGTTKRKKEREHNTTPYVSIIHMYCKNLHTKSHQQTDQRRSK